MVNRSWYTQIVDRSMPVISTGLVEYAVGMGGRVCDLPPRYLDAICESNRIVYPRNLDRRVVELMASDRFVSSRHPLVRGKTLTEVRKLNQEIDYKHKHAWLAKRKKT